MGSNLILKVRLCLNSPLLPSSARFLCTQYIKSNLGGGQMDRRNSGQGDGQSRMKKITYKQDSEDGRSKKYTLRQLPSFPKSVFAAGTAKKIARIQQKKASLVSEDEEEPQRRTNRGAGKLQPPERPLPPDEWRKMKESLGNPNSFDCQMMTSLVTAGSDLDIAKSLLTFVAMETGTLSYELLLRYLTLCVIGGHDDEVFDVYKIMRGSFPSMDTGASTLFIKSFSRTERWKEAVGILQEVKKVFTPSQRNYHDVIAAAVQHGDTATAWSLYDELITNGKIPHQDTWDALFTCVKKTKEEEEEPEHQEKLLRILLYMRNNQIYPQESVAVKIRTWFESLKGPKWTGGWSSITPKGVCRCCGSELESIQLSAEEYQELKDKVMTDVIQGRDVFNKTTPEKETCIGSASAVMRTLGRSVVVKRELSQKARLSIYRSIYVPILTYGHELWELERFKVFVKRKPAFDVVIDGLNVANINKDKNKQSDTLLAVVSALEDQGLNVLVLGRKHMLRPSRFWSKHNMSLIQQKAHCFFTDNISEDDPFLLYATLHSGNHCRFVSRDLMRDHKACLPDGASRRLFFKWQRGHQLVIGGHVAPGRSIRFQSIPEYDTIVQTTGDSWHIPYDDTEDRSTYEVPLRWLCLTKKH